MAKNIIFGEEARKSLQTTTFDSFGVFTPKSITKYCGYYAIAFDFDNVLEIDEYLEMNKYLNPIFSSGNNATNVDNLKNGKTYVSTRIILTKNTSNCIVTDLQGNMTNISMFWTDSWLLMPFRLLPRVNILWPWYRGQTLSSSSRSPLSLTV